MLPFVMRLLRIVASVAVAGIASYALAEQFGTTTALVVWAGLTAAACGLGAVLLRTSELGRVTWKNRLAAHLIPWGWRLNGGRLWPVPLVSWAVWMALGTAAVALRSGTEDVWVRVGLFVAWVIDAAALGHVAGAIRQATPGNPRGAGALWKLAAVPAGLMAASVGLYLAGHAGAALAVAGAPPGVLLAGGGLLMLLLMTLGRSVRWN